MKWVNLADERIGKINKNTYGSLMEVVKYNRAGDIWVKFIEHGNLVHAQWNDFFKGIVKNPYDRTIHGVAYIGEGVYKAYINNKQTPQYKTWVHIIRRCYHTETQRKCPTYIGCSVSEEWHNFQVFGKWFDENYYEIEGETMCIDKDILVKGNKIYSPETCIFAPNRINMLFLKANSKRGVLPVGVRAPKGTSKYLAECKNGNDIKRLGMHVTIEEAFLAYKMYKENIIQQVAEDYKDKIPLKLYEAMISYQV